jgi:hypothetical protein
MKQPNQYSTWDFVDLYNDKKTKGGLLTNEISLEKQFSLLTANSQNNSNKDGFIIHKDYKTPIESFLTYFEFGQYPPPSVMAAIAESFNEYFYQKGSCTLEDCFFGSLTKAIGNNAAISDRDFKFQYMLVTLNDDTKNMTQIEAAEKVITELKIECDVDTFLRQYRRYKKKMDYMDISEIKKKFK